MPVIEQYRTAFKYNSDTVYFEKKAIILKHCITVTSTFYSEKKHLHLVAAAVGDEMRHPVSDVISSKINSKLI